MNTNGKVQYVPTRELAPSMRALEVTLGDLQRRFGETAVMRLGQSPHLYAENHREDAEIRREPIIILCAPLKRSVKLCVEIG